MVCLKALGIALPRLLLVSRVAWAHHRSAQASLTSLTRGDLPVETQRVTVVFEPPSHAARMGSG
jgi:hypothetical protein